MRLKLVRVKGQPIGNWQVHFLVDESSPSCGENRADWRIATVVTLAELVRSIGKLATGETDRVDL